jgi:hypothetical protein
VRAVLLLIGVAAWLGACGDNIRGNISVATPAPWQPAIGELVALTDYRGLSIGTGGDVEIELVEDAAIPLEGYRIDRAGTGRYIVSARDVLGAQYGLSAALENLGFRFRHPHAALLPREPVDQGAELGVVHAPEVRVRGLQLHTLHPIEPYFAFWEPSPENKLAAHRTIDWLVKNRGNYVHWVALDNIMEEGPFQAWKPFTRELIDYAHMRGVRVGINMQLFGSSNLQLAYDLHDRDNQTVAESMAERLPRITQDLPWDTLVLSFGEFFGEAPDKLIAGINEFARQTRQITPLPEMHGFVHVGDKQRVDYMG